MGLLIFIILMIITSPIPPMIFLFMKYFEEGSNRILISLIMLAVCSVYLFLGNLYSDHAHGFDGFNAIGAMWGGYAGIFVSVIVLVISVIMYFRH